MKTIAMPTNYAIVVGYAINLIAFSHASHSYSTEYCNELQTKTIESGDNQLP